MTDSHRVVGSIELLEIVSAEERRNRKNLLGGQRLSFRKAEAWRISVVSSLSTPIVFLYSVRLTWPLPGNPGVDLR